MENSSERKLNLLDATLLVSGSMIGSGIFIVSASMSREVGGPGWLLALWILAGIITIFGALSYGELAGMMPKAGGQYVYLKEAYGPLVAFLYGWTAFLVIQSGTIAAVGVAFAKFSGVLYSPLSENNIVFSAGEFHISAAQLLGIFSIFILTFINSRGIQYGQIILRLFTSTKLIALLGIIFLGLFVFGNPQIWSENMSDLWSTVSYSKDASGKWTSASITGIAFLAAFGAAMVGSLFSSDAWNNVTFIAGEIKDPKKNIPRSLVLGTVIVTGLYILANIAYLNILPFHGSPEGSDVLSKGIQFAAFDRVGVSAATVMFGGVATVIMAILIMISTFGCNNGIIMASARVYQTMATDGLFFEKMKHNNSKGVPGFALWIQFIWCSILCLSGKYGDLLDYVIFAVLLFYILTIAGVMILRKKQPNAERPYKTLAYPFLPIIYILLAGAISLDLLWVKPLYSWPGLGIVLLGIPVYFAWRTFLKSKA